MDIKLKISALLAVQVAVIFFSFQFISSELTNPITVEQNQKNPSFIQQGLNQANTSNFSKTEQFTGLNYKTNSAQTENLFWIFLSLNLVSFGGIASAIVVSMQKETKQKVKTEKLAVVGELAARLNHDLRNPLSVIKNATFLLRHELSDLENERIENILEKMDNSINRMSHQVDDVLNFVRPVILDKKHHLLSTIIQDSIERLEIPEKITIKLPKDDCKILCDNEKLEIVFVNLLTNAIQALEGMGIITISFDDSKKNFVVIEISDNGPGMDSEILSQIFDPLFTTKQLGTGLGLPSCKSLIENQGGIISISSMEGIGTTVKIQIPKFLQKSEF